MVLLAGNCPNRCFSTFSEKLNLFFFLCTSKTEIPNCCSCRLLRNRVPRANTVLLCCGGIKSVHNTARKFSSPAMGDWFHWLAQIIGSKGVHGVTPDKAFAGQLEMGVGAMEEENQKEKNANISLFHSTPICSPVSRYMSLISVKALGILSGANLGQAHWTPSFFFTSLHLLCNTPACLDSLETERGPSSGSSYTAAHRPHITSLWGSGRDARSGTQVKRCQLRVHYLVTAKTDPWLRCSRIRQRRRSR